MIRCDCDCADCQEGHHDVCDFDCGGIYNDECDKL